MGKIEQSASRKRKKENLQKAILATVATAGVISLGAIGPNVVQLLRYTKRSRYLQYRTKNAIGRLAQKGLISFSNRDGDKYAELTPKGEQTLALEEERLKLAKHRKWDGQWRMVAFDIPESKRVKRDMFRSAVLDIGFYRLQNSVWVYPYDCEDFIALLRAELKTGAGIVYAVAREIENDGAIRKHFSLPASKN